MRLLGELWRRCSYLFSRRRMEADLREEMESHRAEMGDVVRFGNTARLREESSDVWGWNWLDDTVRDIRYAARTIVRMPVLAIVVVLSLGVGIGINTTVFSWIQAFVLQPIPGVTDPSDFYLIEPRSDAGSYPGVSWPEYRDLAEGVSAFNDLAAFRMVPINFGEDGRTERVYGLLVSTNYFATLGLEPLLGRFAWAGDGSSNMEAVVSHGFWQRRLGGNGDAIGSTVRVNGQELTVVAVTPPGFQGTVLGLEFDVWVAAGLAPVLYDGSRELEERNQRGYSVMGRLPPGTSHAQAQGDVDAVTARIERDFPEVHAGFRSEVLPFWRAPRGSQQFVLPGLAIFQAVMLLLLLAVCGNTANLILARATVRQREVAVRLAIGGSRSRVIRLLMTESLLLGLAGATIGVLIATWGTTALRAVRFSTLFPVRLETGVDAIGLAFAAALGVVCAVAFGTAPALQLLRGSRLSLQSHSSGTEPKKMRKALMSIEAGLALMVLLAAGLFLQGFRETLDTDPGFQTEGLLLSAYDLSGGTAGHLVSGPDTDKTFARTFTARLLEDLRALPEVESAAIATFVPIDIHGLPLGSFRLEGRPQTELAPDRALLNVVTRSYFETMGIPLVRGTDFTTLDDTTAPLQVIVNEEFVRRFLEGSEPIGRRLEASGQTFTITGVVKDSVYESFGEAPIPFTYYAYRNRMPTDGQIHLRTCARSEALLAPEVARVVRELDPALPVFDVRTMTEHIETNLFLRRIPAQMFVVIAPLLLLLAAIGIYGVVAYNVTRRTREIGIRLAMGARTRTLVRQIVGESMGGIALGMACGWLLAFVVYIHLVPGGSLDPSVFVGIPSLLAVVAITACWIPARRATRLDPVTALRDD